MDPFGEALLPDYDPVLWTRDPLDPSKIALRSDLWAQSYHLLKDKLTSIKDELAVNENSPGVWQEGTSWRTFHYKNLFFPKVPELIHLATTDPLQYQLYRDGYPFLESDSAEMGIVDKGNGGGRDGLRQWESNLVQNGSNLVQNGQNFGQNGQNLGQNGQNPGQNDPNPDSPFLTPRTPSFKTTHYGLQDVYMMENVPSGQANVVLGHLARSTTAHQLTQRNLDHFTTHELPQIESQLERLENEYVRRKWDQYEVMLDQMVRDEVEEEYLQKKAQIAQDIKSGTPFIPHHPGFDQMQLVSEGSDGIRRRKELEVMFPRPTRDELLLRNDKNDTIDAIFQLRRRRLTRQIADRIGNLTVDGNKGRWRGVIEEKVKNDPFLSKIKDWASSFNDFRPLNRHLERGQGIVQYALSELSLVEEGKDGGRGGEFGG